LFTYALLNDDDDDEEFMTDSSYPLVIGDVATEIFFVETGGDGANATVVVLVVVLMLFVPDLETGDESGYGMESRMGGG
jgi:hypothetical protein